MPDPADAFLDAAVRSFDDNAELQMVARRELEEAVRSSPDQGDSLDTLQRRFEEVDAGPRRWRGIGNIGMAIVSLAVFGGSIAMLVAKRDEILWLRGMTSFDVQEIPPEKIARGLAPADRLLLLGDPDASPPGDRMRSLWESEPANPAYLAEHARWQVKEEKALPRELFDEALRLEPDNGYIHYLAAVTAATRCVKEIGIPRERGKPRPLTTFEIVDEARWQRVLDHLHAAAAATRFEGYDRELLRERLKLLPEPEDILSLAPTCDYLFGSGSTDVRGFALTELVSAKAQECLKQGDRDGFLKLMKSWDHLVTRLLENDRLTLLNMMVLRSLARGPLDHLIVAAEGLEEPALALKLRDRKDRLSSVDSSPLRQAMDFEEAKAVARLYGSYFQVHAFHSEMPREPELRPGRLADYALIDRAAALPGWSVLAVAAVLAGAFRFRGSAFMRHLSRRMAMLFGPADQWKIVAGGVALPFLLVVALIHFTPLGSRGWSLSTQGGIIVAGQLLALVLLLLHLPPLLARHLLARRAGRLGLAAPASPGGWLAVLAAAAALPVFGLAQWASLPEPLMERFVQGSSLFEFDPGEANGAGKSWLWTGVGFLGVSVICGLVAVLRLLFSSRKELPRRLVLSRLVLLAYLSGTLVFAISMPVYHAIERHWFAKDAIMKFAPEDWGLTPLEARLTALESAQIREAIESTR